MRGTHSIGKRLLAALLCVAMLAAYFPGMALTASAAVQVGKVADPSTIDGWKNYFGPDVISTEFAGGVWTDKSVFTDASRFSGVSLGDANNFLVAMSAISSTKQVEGQAQAPTDTMLVLDLSNSMDKSEAIPDMIAAANAAISKLLGMNSYNRVGVVLYSGLKNSNDNALTILPLGRYKANSSGNYLAYTGSSDDTTVIRADGMTYENGTADSKTKSKQTSGATYIQSGLYQAWQEFANVSDTTVTSGVMAGTTRTPIYILMSDGEPTLATTSYYNVGRSGVGDGSTTKDQTIRNQLTFLTQLTAAWVKGKAETKYGTDALFYTLGLGISENESATAVLSPASTNNTVSTWWTRFLAGTAGRDVDVYGNTGTWNIYRDAAVSDRNYVDQYWSADDSSKLVEIFDKVAQAIEVESAYTATLVSSGNYDYDGYITFEDEVGELMEVKDVKGILLGDVLFSGVELAKSMNEGLLGSSSNPQALGMEMVATVQERIGIEDVSVAQQLIRSAYNAGQISYDEETGDYSNYIGWYADENGEYLGFWQESYGNTLEGAPEGAKYIKKCYGYLGQARSSDMMHVVVQVSTEIESSHQTVLFRIPASLIPTVTYSVELNGVNMESVKSLTRIGAEPIRLLFEVGMRFDINAVNLEQKVNEYLAEDPAHHVHQNEDGTYTFYTNSWDTGDGDQTPTYDEPLTKYVTESHFHPAYQNERYYYTEDTAIYVADGSGYTLYTGDTQPTGTGYYYRRAVVKANSSGGNATLSYNYAPITADTLANSANVTRDGSDWYVRAGVACTDIARADAEKTSNDTQTLTYSNYSMVVHDTRGYNVYSVLGNNGRLTAAPAQGIKLSKKVSEVSTEPNAPTAFEFTVTFEGDIEDQIKLTDSQGVAFTGSYRVATSGGKTVITVTLADSEEVYITDVPTGTAYEISEEQTVYYSSDKTGDTVTGNVTANHVDDVVFTNAPRQYGQLTITKTVNHPFAEKPAALDGIPFTFEVDLGQQYANKTFPLADGTTATANANGVITLSIKAEQTVTIQGILENTPYTVREINVPQGFAWDQNASSGLEGAVPGQVHLVNNYVPKPPVTNPDVDIVINKSLTGNYTEDETFTFLVEKLNPDTNTYELLGTKTINVAWPSANSGTVSLSDVVSGFTTLGSHTFRLTEAVGSTVGMTYSNQISTFQVNVVDPEMDGILEVEVVSLTNTTVTQDADGYTVTANFTNVYYVGSTYVDVNIHKNLINETGVELSVTDFRFGLYTDPACTQLAQIVEGEHLTVYAGPVGNAVIRIPVTNVSQDGAVYYLKEIVPDTKVPGMTYSDAIFRVTLDVEAVQASGNATLAATAAITLYSGTGEVNNDQVVFTNTFALKKASVDIGGTKSYIRGYDNESLTLQGGEFTFELWTANSDYTVNTKVDTATNSADGSFVFSGLEYTKAGRYVYILREVSGSDSAITYDSLDYYVLVIVTQDGDRLVASVYYRQEGAAAGTTQAAFTNIYNVSGTATTTIRGVKTINVVQGQKVLTGGDFTFGLYKDTDTSAAPIGTVTNRANGGFVFDTITYTAADVGKTFTYTVKEIAPAGAVKNADGTYTLNGVTYTNASFQVAVEVVDNGDGTISAVQSVVGGDSIVFTNDYEAEETSYTVSGRKQLTGRDLKAGEFTFYLYETGADFAVSGTPQQTTNAADGTFSFDAITYDTVGTYYYVVREYIPGVDAPDRLGGVHYDAGVYQITVRVSDTGIGKLAAAATVYRPGSTATEIAFRNTYTTEPAIVALNAQKTYNKTMSGGEFTFTLKGGIDGTTVSQEKTNDAEGKVAFDALTFEKAGVYTFTVTEKENLTTFPWIDFDKTSYTVTVTVTDNGVGQLEATVKYATKDGDIDSISFKNVYKIIEDAEVTLGGNKYYLGDELTAGQFEFGLYEDAQCTKQIGQTVSNDVKSVDLGTFEFPTIQYEDIHVNDLPATYTYYIREILPAGVQEVADGNGGIDYVKDGVFYDPSVYKVEVVLTDNGTGGVNVQTFVNGVENDKIAFTNAYNIVSGTDVVLQGNKIVHNKTIEADQYTFGLYDSEGNELDTTTNLADGTFAFDSIAYTAEDAGKTFTYTVKEIQPAGAVNNTYEGIRYDTTVYTVTVRISDDGNGGLEETVTITGGGTNNAIIFNNYYEVTGEDTVDIQGIKKYYNASANNAEIYVDAGDFSFGLYENNTLIATTETVAGGAFAFATLKYDPEDVGKTFTYEVRETAGLAGYITYDETVFTVIVKVTDDGKGNVDAQMEIVGGQPITFTNTYTNNGEDSLTLGGKKKLFNFRLQEYMEFMPVNLFTFELRDAQGSLIREAKNLADGTFTFRAIEYTAADIGKTYVYTVTERIDGLDYIGYDSSVFTVTVEITDNGEGDINVAYTVKNDGGASTENIAFYNNYKIVRNAQLTLAGTKLYTNSLTGLLKELPAGTFRFNLTGEGVNETVSNQQGGAFSFSTITYDADDIREEPYVYTVTEVKGDLDYVVYDADVYTITVTVSDDGKGGVAVDKVITVNGSQSADIAFDNYYDVVKPGSVEITGTKTYTDARTGADKEMESGMFTFRLTGHGQDMTATNDANGNFSFHISYTKADIDKEYTYTVSEVKGDKGYITYDADTFQVKVKVEDDGQGGLKITKTLVGGADIAFQNYYNIVTGGSVTVDGTKTYTDGRTQQAKPIAAGQFSFNLSGNGVNETVSCDANGSFRFSALNYTARDVGNTYTYTVTEVKGDKDYITYDGKTYTLEVSIADDGQGGLKITKLLNGASADTVSVAFANTYNIVSGGLVEVSGTKTYTDERTQEAKQIPADMFSFKITGTNGHTETVSNAADGSFAFSTLTYGPADIGHIYTYTIEEVKGDKSYITYDSAKYTLVVSVTDNGEGGLKITKLLGGTIADAVEVSFANAYKIVEGTEVEITGTKTYDGGSLAGGDFTFILSEGDRELQRVSNAADGSISFAPICYTKDDIGTHTYTVQELHPTDAKKNADGVYELDGTLYDANVYTVQITVEDNGMGGLKTTKTVNNVQTDKVHVPFDNKYQLTGTGVLKLTGTKNLTGRTLKDGEFTFGLYLNGKQVDSATNSSSAFTLEDTYEVSELGEYTYTVSEVKGNVTGVTYDETVYTVKVKVYDNGKGGIGVDYELVGAEKLSFENVYKAPVTPETGDDFNATLFIGLMILSSFGLAAIMVCRKRSERRKEAE